MASPLPATMRAIRVAEYNTPYSIEIIPVPDTSSLGPHALLVRIACASYCHTDSMVSAGVFSTALPCTASHEGAGTVVFAGSAAGPAFAPGTRVMCGLPIEPCGACADCTSGDESRRVYCTRVKGHAGVLVDGFWADYAVCDARHTTPLPAAVRFADAAPLACAGRTVWRAVNLAKKAAAEGRAPGEEEDTWIAIVGSGGGLGHLGVQFARGLGLRVVGVDARDEALALSRACGADAVVDARAGTAAAVEAVKAAMGAADAQADTAGVHATVNLADAAAAAALACAVTRMHGTVIQVAQPAMVEIPFLEFVMRDIRVHGSVLCSPQESADMVEFVAEHAVKVSTQEFDGLESIEELMEAVHAGKVKGKAVIVVDKSQV